VSGRCARLFFTLADVRDRLERWRQDYNQVRPHSALRDNAPALFAVQSAETAAPGPEPVPAPAGKPAAGKLLELLNESVECKKRRSHRS
jgi:hypothetical protein